ncbi:Uncharacterised protein [Mycobacteroides abscessus subsp. abscessus]|nr:Uncharacterised protein [Mycobacteroides abscessus subsp. abscessus]
MHGWSGRAKPLAAGTMRSTATDSPFDGPHSQTEALPR